MAALQLAHAGRKASTLPPFMGAGHGAGVGTEKGGWPEQGLGRATPLLQVACFAWLRTADAAFQGPWGACLHVFARLCTMPCVSCAGGLWCWWPATLCSCWPVACGAACVPAVAWFGELSWRCVSAGPVCRALLEGLLHASGNELARHPAHQSRLCQGYTARLSSGGTLCSASKHPELGVLPHALLLLPGLCEGCEQAVRPAQHS